VITTSNLGSNGDCAGQYAWNHPVGSDNCGVDELDFTYTNPDGSIEGPFDGNLISDGIIPAAANHNFAVGTTTVTYYVEDVHGNTVSCNFTVTVTDGEDPTFVMMSISVVQMWSSLHQSLRTIAVQRYLWLHQACQVAACSPWV
jgi:hypothetical protein